jgi:hypothetical protein
MVNGMSKTIDLLRTAGVFNDHGFFDGSDGPRSEVWVAYFSDLSRGGHGRYARVYRRSHETDPAGPWYHNGNKAFYGVTRTSEGMTQRAHCLALAQEWAGEQYGITEWARTPFGGYGDAGFVKRRLAELKEQAKSVPS